MGLGRGAGLAIILVGAAFVLYAALQAFSIVMSPGLGKLPPFLMVPAVREFLGHFGEDIRGVIESCILAAFLLAVEGLGVGLMRLGARPFASTL